MSDVELQRELKELQGRVAYLEGRVAEMSNHLQTVSKGAMKLLDALEKRFPHPGLIPDE